VISPATRMVTILAVAVIAAMTAIPGSAGVLHGHLRDAETNAPVAEAEVRIDVHGGYRARSDGIGHFTVRGLPAGPAALSIRRVGYAPVDTVVAILAEGVTELDLGIRAVPFTVETVEVHAERDERGPGTAALSLRGRELDDRRGQTVASTLEGLPGVASRTMGVATARPVIRGLGGNRLAILEDGATTGDLSATADDHAVVLDPLAAERIEVIRGPAALLHGGSVLGGVVNVHGSGLHRSAPPRVSVTSTFTGWSASGLQSGRSEVLVPLGEGWVATGELTLRESGDVATPEGRLHPTDSSLRSTGAGIERRGDRWRLGVAHDLWDQDYSVPGGFLGGHPNGVAIRMDRRRTRGRLELTPGSGPVRKLEVGGTYTRYFHEELESNDVCGVSFGLLTGGLDLRAQLGSSERPFWIGLSVENRDYAQGCLAFVPPTVERSLAGFTFHRTRIAGLDVELAARVDLRRVEPSRIDTNKAGHIRPREFGGWSAAIEASRPLGRGWSATAGLTRSFRAPALEEMFADGPHLAAFSYEVGNADLGPEEGLGGELRLAWTGPRSRVVLSGFVSRFDGFIHTADTGDLEFGPGEEGFLARYQYRGLAARLSGMEVEVTHAFDTRWSAAASGGVVRGQLTSADRPLPRIMPPAFRVELTRQIGSGGRAALAVRGAAEQERLGEFESRTAGYAVVDAIVSRTWITAPFVQRLRVRIENVLDTGYRNHLSRTKSIQPEPGRGVSVLYQVSF